MSLISRALEIGSGWFNLLTKNEEIRPIAEARLAICDGCEYKTLIDSKIYEQINKSVVSQDFFETNQYRCGACGCPLAAKIFSLASQCPKNKW